MRSTRVCVGINSVSRTCRNHHETMLMMVVIFLVSGFLGDDAVATPFTLSPASVSSHPISSNQNFCPLTLAGIRYDQPDAGQLDQLPDCPSCHTDALWTFQAAVIPEPVTIVMMVFCTVSLMLKYKRFG